MAKYFLVSIGGKPRMRGNHKLVIASKRYGHGDPVEVSDGVAQCDLIRRFLKDGLIKSIDQQEYNAILESRKVPRVAKTEKAVVTEPVKTPVPVEPVVEEKPLEVPSVDEESPEPEPEVPAVDEEDETQPDPEATDNKPSKRRGRGKKNS